MKKIKKIIFIIIVMCLSVIIIFSIFLKIFKVHSYEIKSESMIPTYSVGTLICSFPVEREKLKVGDVISYYIADTNIVVTHRIVEIDREKKVVYTKGDNIAVTEDKTPIKYDNIIGVVRFSIPFIGRILSAMSNKNNKIVIIGVLLVGLIILILNNKNKGSKE